MPDEAVYAPNAQGIYVSSRPASHRDEEYDSAQFDLLRAIQERHFWYRGRHRFLLSALRKMLRRVPARHDGLKAIDLGGGCGGWVSYLNRKMPDVFAELALADSSLEALAMAGPVLPKNVGRYQIDLLDLGWRERWDVAFLLDVLEHIPPDRQALEQIYQSLRPGGLLFVTTPALQCFWSYNDDFASHVRRYSRRNFHDLGMQCGFDVCLTRYFMFFLSPLLWISRLKRIDHTRLTREQILEIQKRTHRIPAAPINQTLAAIFAMETPLGRWLPFPWGTSVLGVFRKPG